MPQSPSGWAPLTEPTSPQAPDLARVPPSAAPVEATEPTCPLSPLPPTSPCSPELSPSPVRAPAPRPVEANKVEEEAANEPASKVELIQADAAVVSSAITEKTTDFADDCDGIRRRPSLSAAALAAATAAGDRRSLLERFQRAGAGNAATAAVARSELLAGPQPAWERLEATRGHAALLRHLEAGEVALNKALLQGTSGSVQALLEVLQGPSGGPSSAAPWVLALLQEMLREDAACFALFEATARVRTDGLRPLVRLLEGPKMEQHLADQVAWLLTAVLGHVPAAATEAQVKDLIPVLLGADAEPALSDVGVLDAIANLLKAGEFRRAVWAAPGVQECVLGVDPQCGSPQLLYKSVFALWMLSFDAAGAEALRESRAIKLLRDILANCRAEKVARLGVAVLRNALSHSALAEDIAAEGVLEVVQNLQLEKWRDAELYEDLRDLSTSVASQVQALSGVDRFERELLSGQLRWGPLHLPAFWAENALQLEGRSGRTLALLTELLRSPHSDSTTLAVACRDVGELVSAHPHATKRAAELHVKERVMELMVSEAPGQQEVRKEALLCYQRLLLCKWQAA